MTDKKRLTRGEAIREKCVDCCGGYLRGENSPAGCNTPACSLFPFRLGVEVKEAHLGTEQPRGDSGAARASMLEDGGGGRAHDKTARDNPKPSVEE